MRGDNMGKNMAMNEISHPRIDLVGKNLKSRLDALV
jgi:hypothetical protein